jgi:hypothetical protein
VYNPRRSNRHAERTTKYGQYLWKLCSNLSGWCFQHCIGRVSRATQVIQSIKQNLNSAQLSEPIWNRSYTSKRLEQQRRPACESTGQEGVGIAGEIALATYTCIRYEDASMGLPFLFISRFRTTLSRECETCAGLKRCSNISITDPERLA